MSLRHFLFKDIIRLIQKYIILRLYKKSVFNMVRTC